MINCDNIQGQAFMSSFHFGYSSKLIQSLVLLLLFLSLGAQSVAQNDILDYFQASETGGKVFLKWSISSGETCNGIKITRSSDTIAFHEIGKIDGVCGEADVPVPYRFFDESPLKNVVSYYRLELGVSNFSKIISINIVEKNEAGYQVRPNPIRDKGSIYFHNPALEQWEFSLFSISGALIQRSVTRQNFVDVAVQDLPSGVLLFSLTSSKKKIKGKIISLFDHR